MHPCQHIVLGVHVINRIKNASMVQNLFTEYGCYIRTRIGLHEVQGDVCSPNGIIVLELFGDEAKCEELRSKLAAIEGLDVQQMVFTH